MKAVGIIAEYNPFHKGHLYHLQQAKRICSPDAVCVFLSSCFTQRGSLAMLKPAARAEMALRAGADIVYAMPSVHVLQDAVHYTECGVYLAEQAGCTHLAFGAEAMELDPLMEIARLQEDPPALFTSVLKEELAKGHPYPYALDKATVSCIHTADEILGWPNNTLAIGYLRALIRSGSQMEPILIHRTGDYHGEQPDTEAPGAGALRKAYTRGNWPVMQDSMPNDAYSLLRDASLKGEIAVMDRVWPIFLLRLYHDPSLFSGASAELLNRIRKEAACASGFDELAARCAGKHCTAARVRRLCARILLGVSTEKAPDLPDALWLLGRREDSARVSASLPVLNADGKQAALPGSWVHAEMMAYDLLALSMGKATGMGYTEGVARV